MPPAMRTIGTAFAICLALVATPGRTEPADIAAGVSAAERTEKSRLLDVARKPAEILEFLGLERGDRALDLFGSGGYYGIIMARAVGPQGSVDAWESSNFANSKTRQKWRKLELDIPNLKLISSPARRIDLPESSYDFVMFNLNYHDLYWESRQYSFPRMDPRPFLEAVYRSMKPGAVIGVIDHIADPNEDVRFVAQNLHRIDPARVKADFEAAGFVLEAESQLLRRPSDDHSRSVFDDAVRFRTDQMVLRFRKPG